MLVWPISSPKITRMFGWRPDAADGAGAAAGGAAFCACASAPDVIVAAATSAEEPSRILRRLGARSAVSFDDVSYRSCSLVSSGILGSFFTVRTDDYSVAGVLFTQRNPTWLVDVSTGSAWRAAGR